MNLVIFIVCCFFAILKQNIEGGVLPKNFVKPAGDSEAEEQDAHITLLDSIEKGEDGKEDYNVSFIKNHPAQKKKPSTHKSKVPPKKKNAPAQKKLKPPKKGKNNEGSKNPKLRFDPTTLENDIQTRLAKEVTKQSAELKENLLNNRIDQSTDNDDSSSSTSEDVSENQKKKKNAVQAYARMKPYFNGFIRRTLGGSVEDETLENNLEDGGRRTLDNKRTFQTVYRYENQPLKEMLLRLVMNAMNPSVKNAVKASKTAIDRYVKHTVDKAGTQAALRYTDYTSLRFDKDRIMLYCGGQMYVYNTLKDSKICYNGQVYEVRLI